MAVHQSLELEEASCQDDGRLRTGTLWTCAAHIITAVIGAGVLSLAWSTAQLGWIAAPFAMLCFAVVTYISAFLLSDCYRSPHPVTGRRNYSYMDAVRVNLGEKRTWICGFLQYTNLYGCGIAYTITASISMRYINAYLSSAVIKYVFRVASFSSIDQEHEKDYALLSSAHFGCRAIQKSNCYHREGHGSPCSHGVALFMLLFGAVEIVLSQIPDFHNMGWLSALAAIMSFCYAFIGFGLGLAKVIANGTIKGGLGGVPAESAAQKVWLVSQGLGDIAFSYPYSLILLEIQDTLRSPPAENKAMKKASMLSIFITTFFYLCCGCFGYAAFGDNTPGNLLTGFGFYEPYWLVDLANACIVLHLVGGYQVYSQPAFAFADRWFADKFPSSGFVNGFYTIQLPFLPSYNLNFFRLCFRTLYVVTTTGIAMIFPYFNQVLGVLGALNFWPLAVYFPVEMYFVQRKICAWTRKWIVLRTFSCGCLMVSVFALTGSLEGLFSAKLS